MAGGANISSSGTTTTIHQTTDRAVLHWQGFSIAPGETTTFVQPGASSAVLNRVTSGDASRLMGSLQANGQVYLLNPNGIFIGNGARIDAGSFLATTHNTDEDAFMRGADLTLTGPSTAGIRNEGTIHAHGGDVYLLARTVENAGEIVAPDGTVGLMAGTKFYLQGGAQGAPAVRVELEEGAGEGQGTGVKNTGVIRAAQARLEAAGNLYSLAVSQRGLVQATGTKERADGKIVLSAPGGKLEQAGTLVVEEVGRYGTEVAIRAMEVMLDPASVITAAGREGGGVKVEAEGTAWVQGKMDVTGSGGKGGKITVTGARVGLRGAELDASGAAGGGEILLGGDFQGKNPAVRNAERAYASADSVIRADAVVEGDGGKIITWSDHGTLFYGEAFARGGVEGGDGGLVEVSGRDYLDFQGRANTLAPMGEAGMLLLDPLNLTIQAAGPDQNINLPDDPLDPTDPVNTPFYPIASDAILTWGTINSQLALGNVVVTTRQTPAGESGIINVQDSIPLNSPFNLTLIAVGGGVPERGIVFGAPTINSADRNVITFDGGGSLILEANSPIYFNAVLTINGGNLVVRAGGSFISDDSDAGVVNFAPGTISVTGGNSYFSAGQGIFLNSSPHSLQGEIHATGERFLLDNGTSQITFGEIAVSSADPTAAGLDVRTSNADIVQARGSSVVAPSVALQGENIILESPGNDFGLIGFTLANGRVSLADQNDITFQSSTIFEDFTVRVGRDINQDQTGLAGGLGVLNLQGPVILSAGRDIYLPLAGIGGNELAWGESLPGVGNVVTIERARDVFLGVQNELRLNVATAANFNPPIRNFSLRVREVDLQNSFEISGIATFAGTTDFSPIFIGATAIAPPPGDFLQVTQQNLTRITSASEIRFGAHAYTPDTGVITHITQLEDIRVGSGIKLTSSTQFLAGQGSLVTEAPLSLEIGQIGASRAADFSVVANQITFNAPVVLLAGGSVTLRPFSRSLTIGLNPGGEPVELDLSTSLANITGATSLILGSLSQEGYFVVGNDGNGVSFDVPVIFQTGNNVGQVRLYNNLSTLGSSLQINGNLFLVNSAQVSANQSVGVTGNIAGSGLFNQSLAINTTSLVETVATAVSLNSRAGSSITGLSSLAVTTSTPLGSVTLGGPITSVGSLTITGPSGIGLAGGTVSTTGPQTYSGPVVLGANTTLASVGVGAAGNISFNNSLNGAFSLAINSAGATILGGQVGAITSLSSLTTDAGGTTIINGGRIRASTQTYNDNVQTGGGQLTLFGTSTFNGTVSGPATNLNLLGDSVFNGSLALANLTFSGSILSILGGGSITGPVSLSGLAITIDSGNPNLLMNFLGGLTLAGGPEAINLGGGIRVSGATTSSGSIFVSDGFSLRSDLNLQGLVLGRITINGPVSGGPFDGENIPFSTHTLEISSPSGVTFGSAIGQVVDGQTSIAAPLSSLTVGSALNLNGGLVRTVDNQTYQGPVTLGANTVVRTTGTTPTIEFQGTVTGDGRTLTLMDSTASSQGSVIFQETLNVGSLVTFGDTANYSVSLLGGGTIGSATTFANPGALTLGGAGKTTTFTGGLTATAPSSVTLAGGTIQTAGGSIVLGDAGTPISTSVDTALSTGSASVSLGGSVNGPGALTVNAGSGTVTLGGMVGSGIALRELALTGGSITFQTTGVTTSNASGGTGNQTYTGSVILGTGNDTTVALTATGGTVTFLGSLSGTTSGEQGLAIQGNAVFGGVVGSIPLASLSVSGTTMIRAPGITTSSLGGGTGNQSFAQAVSLQSGTTLTGGSIIFGAAVDGSQALTVAGNASFGGLIGGNSRLESLLVSGTAAFGGGATAVNTRSFQSYAGNLAGLGSPLALSAGGSLSLGSLLDFGAVTIGSRGRVSLNGAFYQTGPLTITSASLVNRTGVSSPFASPDVVIVTDRPNGNSPNSFNGGFGGFGYVFLPAPQIGSIGPAGTMVYRYFDVLGVATPLQYTETVQTFAYSAAVPVTGYAGPRPYAGEVRLGRIEGTAPFGSPGEEIDRIPPPPTQLSRTKPKYGSPFAKVLITEREKAKAAEAREKSMKSGVGRLKVPDTAQVPPAEIRYVDGERLSLLQSR